MKTETAQGGVGRRQLLQFNRNGSVRLTNYGPDPIGRVIRSKRTGPRGGEFEVFDWKPNISCPPHLLGPIHQSTRMRQIHSDLLSLHHPRPKRQAA